MRTGITDVLRGVNRVGTGGRVAEVTMARSVRRPNDPRGPRGPRGCLPRRALERARDRRHWHSQQGRQDCESRKSSEPHDSI